MECDLETSLVSWVEENSNSCTSSQQVEEDLHRIASLRTTLVQAGNEHAQAVSHLSTFQEYHAYLLAFHDFFGANDESSNHVEFPWRMEDNERQDLVNLAGERVNVLWNIACLLSYQASIQEKRDRSGWNQAHGLLQEAASLLQHLLEDDDIKSHHDTQQVTFWNAFLLAQAQIATYYMALASPKPRHVVLAKLASAALPLLQTAIDSSNEQTLIHSQAWKTWMMSLSQYHESCVHRQKKQSDFELARLLKAKEAIQSCQQVVYSSSATKDGMDMLRGEVPKMVKTIHDRLEKVQQQYDGPPATSLREIRGELLVKTSLQPLPRTITTLSQPLFQNVQYPRQASTKTTATSPHSLSPHASSSCSSSISLLQQAVDRFQTQLESKLQEINELSHDKMEHARMILADANLPHSLTAYKQQQQHEGGGDGGIPLDLWERMELLQQEELIPSIKRDLWALRERADFCVELYQDVQKQLDDDLKLDRTFRQENPHFIGHDTMEVQRSFRSSLERYEGLLRKSRTGDATLMQQCTSLDTDPKYKLLQFSKVQLDRLLSSTGISRQKEPIDTTQLARLLVALSSLFDEREELLDTLEAKASEYDIESKLATIDPSSPNAHDEYERVVQESIQSFEEVTFDIRTNISRQVELVDSILHENEDFVKAREAGPPPNANENCILMIEDAIDEAEQLKKHLREGIEFYNVVIPKLERLQHEVGDASARLAIERCEYEDGARNRSQESDDARLAASLAERGSSLRSMNGHGPLQILTDSGEVLDDAKVANLVDMNFDPEKVVAALKKHNNDMDQALNQLLCE